MHILPTVFIFNKVTKYKILFKHELGFRNNRFTIHELISLVDLMIQ